MIVYFYFYLFFWQLALQRKVAREGGECWVPPSQMGSRSPPDQLPGVSGSTPSGGSVRTQGQQVFPGAATEAAIMCRVGGGCPAVAVMARGLGQGLWDENQFGVLIGHQPLEMSSFQPLQQLPWRTKQNSAPRTGDPRGPLPNTRTHPHAHFVRRPWPSRHL